jgi:hypothetical protein
LRNEGRGVDLSERHEGQEEEEVQEGRDQNEAEAGGEETQGMSRRNKRGDRGA